MARPTKYGNAIERAICLALKNGCTRTAAAHAAGINYSTFQEWMNGNPQFSILVIHAEAEAEKFYAEVLRKAALGAADKPADWRAAESWLKRRRRIEWGDKIDIGNIGDAELLAEVDRRIAAAGGGPTTPDDGSSGGS